MRICLISSSFYPSISFGGPISVTWDLSRKLGQKGIKVFVSTTNSNGKEKLKNVNTSKHENIEKNIFVRYYNEQIINIFSLSFIFNVFSDIKKSDIVYLQYLFHYTVIISLFYTWILKKKVILCPRGCLGSWGMNYNNTYLLKKIWIFFFIKPFIKNIIWQASYSLKKDDILSFFSHANVEIIHDGIDFDKFTSGNIISKRDLVYKYTNCNFNAVSDVVFTMGRLHKIKRFDIIIDAFCLYVRENKKSKLLIAGADDGEKSKLEYQINNLGLQKSVFLIGLVDFSQKKELFSNSSFFALASEFESFGIVVAESLACGTPVVVSDKTFWKDIQQNKCGIFAKNDSYNFLNSFYKIKSEKFSDFDCRNFVKKNFDLDVISEKFIKVITNL